MAKSNNSNHAGAAQTVQQHIKDAEAEAIQDDIQAFLKRGGKIQVLGNTPLRWENRRKTKSTKGMDPAFHRPGKTKGAPA